ncbi:hypothetical protein QTO34_005581 [Cnephaeus nilssonii]|uniref:Uncharacterized protein n=1 Tax=Cnephaeus nilssonii TaxID=3371016 RepID=A0AA40LK22_CNENI|nr:hypothetical protein QTO34_005581 [Eptesicus nilssonii]
MAQISVWLVAGVMLCSIPAGSLEEDIRWLDIRNNKEVLILLYHLQRTPPYLCLDDRNNFNFPWNLETILKMKKTQRTCFRHVILTQILYVFATRRSFAEWDHSRLSELISSLHQRLGDLEDEAKKEGNNLACPNLGRLIRKYFQGIYKYLKEKKYSSCGGKLF